MKIEMDLQDLQDCQAALIFLADDMESGGCPLARAQIKRRVERYRNLAMKFELIMGDEYMEVNP